MNRCRLRSLFGFDLYCIAVAALGFATGSGATEITVVGLSPNKAVVQIDGGAPRTLSIGQKTAEGVVLVSVDKGGAVFDIAGKRRSLKLGQQHATSNSSSAASVTVSADSRGHFVVDGQINGGAVRFIVDTGATVVAMSSFDAQRLRINYRKGEVGYMNTANGTAPAWRVKLDTVRVGEITVNNVDAVVMENQTMPVLLGMSFLNRTNMRREGQLMTLTKRF